MPSTVREVPVPEGIPAFVHPGWRERFPWLVQGVTGRGSEDEPFDLGLFGRGPSGPALERWEHLRRWTGLSRVVHHRQVHGARVTFHHETAPGWFLAGDGDGHATRTAGILLTVSLADCVPVFLVAPRSRAVALLHAGWRGTAAGILSRGLATLAERLAAEPGEVHVHLGPAICGTCYEVGPEVHGALGLDVPEGPEPVDLRAVLARQAVRSGVDAAAVSISDHCTLCGRSGFFSHRGGDAGRQVGFLGTRPRGSGV